MGVDQSEGPNSSVEVGAAGPDLRIDPSGLTIAGQAGGIEVGAVTLPINSEMRVAPYMAWQGVVLYTIIQALALSIT